MSEALDFCLGKRAGYPMWDVGAHHGAWTLAFAKTGSEVLAVEPDPVNAGLLGKAVLGAGPDIWSRVAILPAALCKVASDFVTIERGETSTHVSTRPGWERHMRPDAPEPDTLLVCRVAFFELREWWGGVPALVKFDCEGMDGELVVAALEHGLEEARMVCWESGPEANDDEARAALGAAGFRRELYVNHDGVRQLGDEVWCR